MNDEKLYWKRISAVTWQTAHKLIVADAKAVCAKRQSIFNFQQHCCLHIPVTTDAK